MGADYYTPFTLQAVSPVVAAFGETSLSLDHRLMSVCDLAGQWRTVHYLGSPTEVLDCLTFLPVVSVPWACADDFAHANMNF